MSTVAEESLIDKIVEPALVAAAVSSVDSALTMCETKAHCVGVSSVPYSEQGIVTGLVGVHGKVSGFITVNMAERFAIKAVEGFSGEKQEKLSVEVIDGVGEITNLIAGGIKGALSSSPWSFTNITVPSVIVGSGYQIAYAKGLHFLCAQFEHDDPQAMMLHDRILQISISLLRL